MDPHFRTASRTVDRALHTCFRSSDLSDFTRTRRNIHYRKLSRGVWVARDADTDIGTIAVAHALTIPGSVVSGWSAATLYGIAPPRAFPPELTVPPTVRSRTGIEFRRARIPDRGTHDFSGVRVLRPNLMGFEIARFSGSHLEAVQSIEHLARGGLSLTDLSEVTRFQRRAWGAHRVRAALNAADTRSQSPKETEVRILFRGAGITGFEPQVRVPELGYVLDLGHRAAKVGVEYDGAYHQSGLEQAKAAERRNRLQAAGWTMIYVTWLQLEERPGEIIDQVRQALRDSLAA